MTDASNPKSPAADAVKPPPVKVAEMQAVLLKPAKGISPGRVVRGPETVINALLKDGAARPATDADRGIAAGRSVKIK